MSQHTEPFDPFREINMKLEQLKQDTQSIRDGWVRIEQQAQQIADKFPEQTSAREAVDMAQTALNRGSK